MPVLCAMRKLTRWKAPVPRSVTWSSAVWFGRVGSDANARTRTPELVGDHVDEVARVSTPASGRRGDEAEVARDHVEAHAARRERHRRPARCVALTSASPPEQTAGAQLPPVELGVIGDVVADRAGLAP